MEGRYAEWRRLRDNWREAALKAFEFIRFQKSLETKIARVMVKSAFTRQHARVEKKEDKSTKPSLHDTLQSRGWKNVTPNGGDCVITGVKPQEVNRPGSEGSPE